jgi:hypothetical protein
MTIQDQVYRRLGMAFILLWLVAMTGLVWISL